MLDPPARRRPAAALATMSGVDLTDEVLDAYTARVPGVLRAARTDVAYRQQLDWTRQVLEVMDTVLAQADAPVAVRRRVLAAVVDQCLPDPAALERQREQLRAASCPPPPCASPWPPLP